MKLRIFKLSFFILGLVLSLLTTQNKSAFGDTSIGIYIGSSFIIEEKPYREKSRNWGVGYDSRKFSIMDTKEKYGLYFQYFPRNKRLGFCVEVFVQNYIEEDHDTINGVDKPWSPYRGRESLVGLVLSLNYRFFRERGKRFNPYVSLGYVILDDADIVMGSSEPCPSKTDVKVGGGIRYRITNRFFMNLGISYFPANSFSSIRGGLEISL